MDDEYALEEMSELDIQRMIEEIGTEEALEKVKEQVSQMFTEKGFEMTEDDFQSALEDDIPEAEFPYGIMLVAVIKDTADGALTIAFPAILLTLFGSVITTLTFFFWQFGKTRVYERKGFLLERRVITIIISFIPIINALPEASLYVLDCYRRDRKLRQIFMRASQALKPFKN